MYTSYIGKKFLKLYNAREGKNLSAKDFFDHIQFPIFFDNDNHLMHVHGSTFFQKVGKDDSSTQKREALIRLERLHKDVALGKKSGSTYVGYAAEKTTEVTSGQVTSLNYLIDEQEIYASWIGEGLALGLSGGLLLIDKDELLWDIFQGWQTYRKFLNQTPNVKPRQIETWNGHWLYYLSAGINSDIEIQNFQPPISGDTEEVGKLSIPTIAWVKVIFALAKKYPNEEIIGNAYVLSKTNSTYGFIKIHLPKVRKLYELRDQVFIDGKSTIISDEEIESLSTFYRYKDACRLGVIGLNAIEPAKLREYMPKGSMLYAQGKEYKFSNEESYTNYQLFKIWIIAMLNKTELLGFASDVAKVLIESESQSKDAKRGKSTTNQENKNLLESKSLKEFIDELTDLMGKSPLNSLQLKKVVEEVIKMPYDIFPLFVTLIRFEYSYQKINK